MRRLRCGARWLRGSRRGGPRSRWASSGSAASRVWTPARTSSRPRYRRHRVPEAMRTSSSRGGHPCSPVVGSGTASGRDGSLTAARGSDAARTSEGRSLSPGVVTPGFPRWEWKLEDIRECPYPRGLVAPDGVYILDQLQIAREENAPHAEMDEQPIVPCVVLPRCPGSDRRALKPPRDHGQPSSTR